MKVPSFEVINYALRPAKAAERKMLCDLIRRLDAFGKVDNYRYIGFGSVYFADFQLLHQIFGISDMVSIEREVEKERRFEFNKPFRCIQLQMGDSGAILPQLDWGKRVIVWLDYDGKLSASVLADVATVCSKARSGSLVLVSVNVQPEATATSTFREQEEQRLQTFKEAVGPGNVPLGLSGADLRGPKLAEVCRRVISNTIRQELASRNGPLGEQDRIQYRQLINFRYADGAKMLTVGGVLYATREEGLATSCSFSALPFVRASEDACEIRAPRLTPKEVRHLNAQLPHLPADQLEVPGVPEVDIKDFAAIYRYYPTFGEVLVG